MSSASKQCSGKDLQIIRHEAPGITLHCMPPLMSSCFCQQGRRKISDATGTSVGGVATVAAQAKLAAKPDKSVTDFYRFQQRDKHRNELATLREQFEADKRKVAELRASRRFKPY